MSVERYSAVMKILDDQNHLSERADSKAISLLSMLGIFTVFFVSQIGNMQKMDAFMDVVVVVYFISVLLAIIQIIMAISPRIRTIKKTLKANPDAKPIPQPTFFAGICKFPDPEEYKKYLDDVIKNDEEITDIYVNQIYQVAQINATKYACVNRAVWFVVLAIGSQLAIIAYLFASKPPTP
jgi:hypothetical protein